MITPAMLANLVALRQAVPSKDYDLSRRFYEALGFSVWPIGERLAHVQIGQRDGLFCFLLQGQYDEVWARNALMHLTVRDVDAWWAHIEPLDLARTFGVTPPQAPRIEPWGLKTAYFRDPAGVVWHIAQDMGNPNAA